MKIPGTDIDVLVAPLPGWLKLKMEDAQMQNSFKISDFMYDIIINCILDPDTGAKIFDTNDKALFDESDLTVFEQLAIKAIELSAVTTKEFNDLTNELKKMNS